MVEEKIIKKNRQKSKEFSGFFQIPNEGLFNFLPSAICVVDPAGIIVTTNQIFQNLTTYNPSEVIGQKLGAIFTDNKKINNLLVAAGKKGMAVARNLDLISQKKEKISVDIFILARKDKNGNILGYFLSISNVSEIVSEIKTIKKELQIKIGAKTKELEESRAALLNILEDVEEAWQKTEEERNKTEAIITNFADGLLVFDKDDKVSLINHRAEKIFNIKSPEILRKTISELIVFPSFSPLSDIFRKEIAEVFRKEVFLKENLIIELSIVPIERGEEKIGNLVIIHDVTREKMIERMKSEFVSISAHQLRTPLSAIKWTLKMILEGDVGQLTREQKELLQKTYDSNERMISLINDLLDVTRIEEGKDIYKPVVKEVIPFFESLINLYKEEAKRRKLKLEFRRPDGKIPKVLIDAEKIKLVMQNLLENAIRYTPESGRVTISLGYDKKELEVQIQDTGVGVPANQKERIFTKFFRGANVIRMETEGSGLGLFIAKNIVEAHGGRIWFESEENKGSTFHFTIPIKMEFEEFLKEF